MEIVSKFAIEEDTPHIRNIGRNGGAVVKIRIRTQSHTFGTFALTRSKELLETIAVPQDLDRRMEPLFDATAKVHTHGPRFTGFLHHAFLPPLEFEKNGIQSRLTVESAEHCIDASSIL
ncbi:MAG: hypothetical protein AAB737_03365 [Patescibacteria group bacterium]